VFERRLRIVLGVLVLLCLMLFGRVCGMQVFGHSYWSQQAMGLLIKPTLTETTRGRIYDFRGHLLAEDTACTDACVDYRAIIDPPDPAWVHSIALEHLSKQLGVEFKKIHGEKRAALIADEDKAVRAQLRTMWSILATLYQPTDVPTTQPGDIDADADTDAGREKAMTELRHGIVQTVQFRRQSLIARSRQKNDAKSSALMRWIFADADTAAASAGDDLVIEDQREPHVILHALDSDACNFLGKHLDDFPGLVLRPSTHRYYPMGAVAAHVMGRMSRVAVGDLPPANKVDSKDLRRYLPNDTIGREGVEALCEPLLRGTRGQIEKQLDGTIIGETAFQPGADVRLSIDADLQAKVQQMLQHVEIIVDNKGDLQHFTPPGGVSMHAAAVVLDVKTNEVRVLASNPGYDVNDLETRATALRSDTVNQPLRDRATSDELEPGSTVKPLLGLGAITQGLLRPQDTIECTGVLYVPEIGPHGQIRRRRMPGGRCWILSEHGAELRALHLPDNHGPLTYAQALERSCDIYFETIADRLGPAGVNHWYDQFGLGRITGIGIYETPGLRSGEWKGPVSDARMNNCLSGMGQGTSWATPLQIANEAATIARGGIWMRPTLLSRQTQAALDEVHPRSPNSPPDAVDLHLDPDALRAAKIGMRNVVDGSAGTGKIEHPAWLSVAAKTGTADTSPLYVKTPDADGKMVLVKRIPVIRGGPETSTPWYRSDTGKTETVAWYMGFAPVEDPKIAFCVMVEYAGAGGGTASGPIVTKILNDCAAAGYFPSVPATSPALSQTVEP
jgi:penicillin-binding protein 2